MKRVISVILVMVLLVSVFGVNTIYAYNDSQDVAISDEPVRYSYLASLSASITKESLGFVNCISSYSIPSASYTIVLTCILQRTDGSAAWSNYKSASKVFTGAGAHLLEKSWFAPSGYSYRTYTKVEVKNSSGTILETEHVVSSVLYK